MEQQSRPEGPGPFARQRLVMGEEAMDRLARARVAVFGLGRRRKPGGTAKLCLRPCKTTQRRRLFCTLRPIIKEVCDHG